MLYIKLFIEREKNIGQSAPECPFNSIDKKLRHFKIANHHISKQTCLNDRSLSSL